MADVFQLSNRALVDEFVKLCGVADDNMEAFKAALASIDEISERLLTALATLRPINDWVLTSEPETTEQYPET